MKLRLFQTIMIIILLLSIVPCTGQTKIVAIDANDMVLAMNDDGTVYAWGDNRFGQLGIGTSGDFYPPGDAQKVAINNVTAIATAVVNGYVLKKDGTVWAWGDGRYGGLGNGDMGVQVNPVQVTGLADVVAITTSSRSAYALKKDGTVWAWGDLSDGNNTAPGKVYTPIQLPGLTDIVALGEHSTYAIRKDGTIYVWGEALGADPEARYKPKIVEGIKDVKQIVTTYSINSTLYLKNDGTVWGWGLPDNGILGEGTENAYYLKPGIDYLNKTIFSPDDFETIFKWPPVQARIENVRQITASHSYHTAVALKNDGTVWEWGNSISAGYTGGMGLKMTPYPTQINGIDHVVQVSAGNSPTVALKDDGSVWGWGFNSGKVLKDAGSSDIVFSPKLLFTAPEPTPTPTPAPSPTTTITSTPAATPTIAPSDTPSPTPTLVPSVTSQQASTPTAPIDGLIVEIAGIIGLVLAAAAIIYIWLTKRL